MRSVIVVMTAVILCVVTVFSVLTISNRNLQKNELENALDIALDQSVRSCVEEGITDANGIANTAVVNFKNYVASKRGTLVISVLYADENIVDLYASFTYTQYNGSEKVFSARKTVIRDWTEGEEDFIIRQISEKYLNESAERGGVKEDSVWRTNATLKNKLKEVLTNKQDENGAWAKSPVRTETIDLRPSETKSGS